MTLNRSGPGAHAGSEGRSGAVHVCESVKVRVGNLSLLTQEAAEFHSRSDLNLGERLGRVKITPWFPPSSRWRDGIYLCLDVAVPSCPHTNGYQHKMPVWSNPAPNFSHHPQLLFPFLTFE